uniref:CD109 antigen n=1 Tax=Cacopsylla melanoneura TaxID=428564 RepID=A0A8D8R0S6_9HEMI
MGVRNATFLRWSFTCLFTLVFLLCPVHSQNNLNYVQQDTNGAPNWRDRERGEDTYWQSNNPAVNSVYDNNVIIHEASYFIVTSKLVRPGQIYKLSVRIYYARHPIYVRSSIQRNGVEISSNMQHVKENIPETLIMRIPPTSVPGDYKLRVEGLYDGVLGGIAFLNETNLVFSQRSMTIFIQTDKPIYKQGETIKFRAIPINTDLKAFDGAVDVYMLDPKRYILRRWLSRQSNLGTVSLNYQLSDQPVFGEWIIQVVAQNQVEELKFVVQEYYQTRFEVNVTMSPFFFTTDKYLTGVVMANYTSGGPVDGNLTLKASIHPVVTTRLPGAPQVQTIEKYFNFDESYPFWYPRAQYADHQIPHLKWFHGVYRFKYDMSELEKYVPTLENMEVKITATVGDRYLDEIIDGFSTTRFYNSSVRLTFFGGSPQVFKPTMPFNTYLAVSFYDGSSLDVKRVSQGEMKISGEVLMQGGRRRSIDVPNVKMSTDHNGVYEMKLDLRSQLGLNEGDPKVANEVLKDIESMKIQAFFKDIENSNAQADLLLFSHYSPSDHQIKISTSTRNAKVGEFVIFHVQSNFMMDTFDYVLLSKVHCFH